MLEVFVRVAEAQSFSRAAESLKLPRSNVSAAIRALEVRLGTRLLNRTTRSMSLTASGAAYLDWCIALLADIEATEHAISGGTVRPAGRLHVDAPSRVARRVICPALPEFLERYPEIVLELSAGDRPSDLVRNGVDCAIRVGELHDSGLVARPIGELGMGSFASPDYLERHGVPRELADLERHRLVGFAAVVDDRRSARWWYADGDAERSVTMRAAVTVDDAESYIACCVAGVGLIQIPSYDARELVARGELIEVLPNLAPAPMPMAAIYPERRYTPARVQVFVGWMRELYEQRMRGA